MVWVLIWSAVMPSVIFFAMCMTGLAVYVRSEEDKQRKLKLAQKKR